MIGTIRADTNGEAHILVQCQQCGKIVNGVIEWEGALVCGCCFERDILQKAEAEMLTQ